VSLNRFYGLAPDRGLLVRIVTLTCASSGSTVQSVSEHVGMRGDDKIGPQLAESPPDQRTVGAPFGGHHLQSPGHSCART